MNLTYHVAWKNPDTKEYTLYVSIDMKYKMGTANLRY